MKNTALAILLFVANFAAFSQGQSPNGIDWREINTEHARVIYPAELEKEAQRAANLVTYLHDFQTKTLKSNLNKTPIILFNRTTRTNGFAGLMPRRSGWYVTPFQNAADIGSDDWFQTLAAHEYRHIAQYSKSNAYFTKFLSVLFGDLGIAIGSYSFPNWFYEGDAIMTETAFGAGGRGRMPSFDMPVRTQYLNGIRYKYHKTKFNSYKDFYPNHYHLGWLLVSYGRERYGADVWDKTLEKASRISIWPYAFSRGMKKTIGLNERKYYNEAMSYYDSVWTAQSADNEHTVLKTINTSPKKLYTRYYEPQYLDNENVLVKKSDLSEISALYILDKSGKETKLFDINAEQISTEKSKIVWTTEIPDTRWQLQSWSDVYIFDIQTYTQKRLTKKQKYFAPELSPDATQIAVVEHLPNMQTCLVLIDSETGKELKRFANPENRFIRTPSWSEDGKQMTYTATGLHGTGLYVLDIETETEAEIVAPNYENLSRPMFYRNSIVYNSTKDGIDNIFKINIDTEEVTRIVSAQYGAFCTDISEDKLLMQNYTVSGYNVAEFDLKSAENKSVTSGFTYLKERNSIFTAQEQGKNVFDSLPTTVHESKRYKAARDAVKIHSWSLNSEHDNDIGLVIYSDNYLNTLSEIATFGYDLNTRKPFGYLTTRISKFYPIIDLTGGKALRQNIYTFENEEDTVQWFETFGNVSVTVPFDISRSVWSRGFDIKSSYSITNINDKFIRSVEDVPSDVWFSTSGISGSFHNYRYQATRDLSPKYGQYVTFIYNKVFNNQPVKGYQYALYSALYLPGFGADHSFVIKTGAEFQHAFSDVRSTISKEYQFPSVFEQARGHDYRNFSDYYKLSMDYRFPLWYPDLGGSFLYFKRLSGAFFHDSEFISGRIAGRAILGELRASAGAEISVQFFAFGLGLPLEVGARFAYPYTQSGAKPQFSVITMDLPLN